MGKKKMNIELIAEHSVDLDILPPQANILDIGCRGFLFAKAMRELGHHVTCVDCDRLVGHDLDYIECAITGKNGSVEIVKSIDPQATKTKPGIGVHAYTLRTFSEKFLGSRWSLIKMDVEGAEYDIIMGLDYVPATQLSIEFHLHTGAYTIFHMNEMENKLADLGYRQAKHEYTEQHGAGLNYWDSLFILK